MRKNTGSLRLSIFATVLMFAAGQGQSQQGSTVLDGAVNEDGTTYILTPAGMKVIDAAQGTSQDATLDPKSTLTDHPGFTLSFNQALTLETDGPVILWSGKTSANVAETYVTFAASQASTKLTRAVGIAVDVAIASNGNIFVCGLSKGLDTQYIVHQFSSNGNYIRSFHLLDTTEPIHESDLSHAKLVTTETGLYVVSPFLSNAVYEYGLNGTLTHTYNFDQIAPQGKARRLLTMFPKEGAVYVQSVVGDLIEREGSPPGAMGMRNPESEVHSLQNGSTVLELSVQDPTSTILGITPDGKVIERSIAADATRNTISISEP